MTPDKFLRELEPLTHKGRVQFMIALGRRAAANDMAATALRQTLKTLEAGDFYQRYMSLQACQGSRDGAQALQGLSDPSRIIRGLAIGLVPLLCTDEQILTALVAANFEIRRVLLLRLYKRRRQAVIDTFLAQLVGNKEEEPTLSKLLAFGSAEFVGRHLALPENSSAATDWALLTKIHPDRAVGLLLKEVLDLQRPDYRVLRNANRALPFLSLNLPDRAMELAEALLKKFSLSQLTLGRLVTQRPNQLAGLVVASPDQTSLNFDRVLGRLETGRVIGLLSRQNSVIGRQADWLKRLKLEQRRAVYQAMHQGWQQEDGTIPATLIAGLPTDLRQAEARRILALPALATSSQLRLNYAGYLPWQEAQALINSFIGDPDPDLRVMAHTALGTAVYYHRERVQELLAVVRARRNEQDPVRQAMLKGLTNLPPGTWKLEHLAELGGSIRESLNAKDLSTSTASQLERLIIKILPFHPDWAAGWLATLVKERGQFRFFDLQDRLTDRDIARVAAFLLPVLQSWTKREREAQLLAAAQSLGRRLRVFDALVQILVEVLKRTQTHWLALGILNLFTEYRRDILPGLIPGLLKDDQSWITLRPVYEFLHRWRQDLLTPYLGQRAYKGRFSTGKTRLLLPFDNGFQRWTPSQQSIFARTLSEVAGDEMRDSPGIIASIRQLQALPGVPPVRLVELSGDKREAVRDSAIGALGRLDAGEGVPVLLDMLNDERARIAIYALRRSLLDMPAASALAVLTTIPLTKITVAKEVVRLLGELRQEAAYQELLVIASEKLHRDIRVAVLRGLWNYLEREETWPFLLDAASDPDPAIATVVGRIPTDVLTPASESRLVRLLGALLNHPEARVRSDVLTRCSQLPVSDREQVLLPKLVTALESLFPGEYTLAAEAIMATYDGQDAPVIGEVTARILPRRKTLQTLVDHLLAQSERRRAQMLPTVRAVLSALEADKLTAEMRVKLAVSGLDFADLAQLLVNMAGQDEMHESVVVTAAQAIEKAGNRADATALTGLEEVLASNPDARLRRLALAALIGGARTPQGWDTARLERLRMYRADPASLVAAAAQFTFPPGEE